jgi:hypothetical protein
MKNRKRESCTSGSVRDEGGNILIYSAAVVKNHPTSWEGFQVGAPVTLDDGAR